MKTKLLLFLALIAVLITNTSVNAKEIEKSCSGAQVSIQNVDYYSNPIKGIKFGVYKNNKLLETKSSNDDGSITFSCLSTGNYVLKETSVPDGITNNKTKYNIHIKRDNQKISIQNTHLESRGGHATIRVYSAEGAPVSGVSYGVYDENWKLVEKITTDENGMATTSSLPNGHYYMQCITTKRGYTKDITTYEFIIGSSTTFKQYKASINKQTGNLSVSVIDQDANKLKGATFNLYSSDDNLVKTLTSDENGLLEANDLSFGKYYIKQDKALDG